MLCHSENSYQITMAAALVFGLLDSFTVDANSSDPFSLTLDLSWTDD